MRICYLIFILVIGFLQGNAQRFQSRFQTSLSDSLNYESVSWVDFDNDSLPDVVVSGKNTSGEIVFTFFKTDAVAGLTFRTVLSTSLTSAVHYIVDLDSDNQMDIVVSGIAGIQPMTLVFYNQGNFGFQQQNVIQNSGSLIHFADFDTDGKNELLLSGSDNGQPFFNIYKLVSGSWNLVHDSIRVEASSIQTFDFDNDTDQDLFISGIDSDNNPGSWLYLNHPDLYFKRSSSVANLRGKTSVSDLNHDGRLDILLSGVTETGNNNSVIFLNQLTGFTIKDSIPQLNNLNLFTGDFNSNGSSDLSLYGTQSNGDSVNLIQYFNESYDTLNSQNLRSQAFGDYDRDGDLDLIQVLVTGSSNQLAILENLTAEKNNSPEKPFNPIAAVLFDHVFLYWEKPSDDHSPSGSLTYDVNIRGTSTDLLTANFDQINFHRLLVSHGSVGTANYVLLEAAVTTFDFAIQAIDNSYHAAPGGVCSGNGGGGGNCSVVKTVNMEACQNEKLTLLADSNALWFSFDNGFIGSGTILDVTTYESDTIFSVQPITESQPCGVINIYTVTVSQSLTKTDDELKYVCEGQTLEFTAEPGFDIEWSSANKGFLSNNNELSVTVTTSDTIKLKLTNGSGCNILRRTTLAVSKPTPILEAEAYEIIKGQSVQLQASGGESYRWDPPSGLDNASVGSPIATPSQTTEYNVTIMDSIGCQAFGKVLIIVEQTAFIPNLFTPNDDGKNDELKVYGLSGVNNLTFSIYNREGSLVYSSGNVSEVSNSGWNGMVRGVKQPVGIYYWNIIGETDLGTKILLNGKSNGSIVLIR